MKAELYTNGNKTPEETTLDITAPGTIRIHHNTHNYYIHADLPTLAVDILLQQPLTTILDDTRLQHLMRLVKIVRDGRPV